MSFRLSGEVKDAKLFKEIMAGGLEKGGKLFYREDNEGNIVDLVYFSGAKRVVFSGKIDQEFAAIIRAEGSKVKILQFNEDQGILKIHQE